MTVRENLEFPLKLAKIDKEERRRARRQRGRGASSSTSCSTGSRRISRRAAPTGGDGPRDRAGAGRVPARRAALEPRRRVAGPDARSSSTSFQDRLSTTTVYVTHDQTEAMTLGDRVAVLREGVHPAGGPAQGALPRPGEHVRGRVHWLAGDELLPGRGRRRPVELPMGEYGRPTSCKDATGSVIAGIRPEHFEDVAPSGGPRRTAACRSAPRSTCSNGSAPSCSRTSRCRRTGTRRRRPPPTKWRGSSATPACAKSTRRSRRADRSRVGDLRGDEVELWLDTSRVHYFDAETGENLAPLDDRGPSARRRSATARPANGRASGSHT